jgi:hypothetical protein
LHREVAIENLNARRQLTQGDEARKRAYMATLEVSTSVVVSFAQSVGEKVAMATRMGLDVVLQRKGLVLDVQADTLSRVRASLAAKDQALLTHYEAAIMKWASLSIGGLGALSLQQYQAQFADHQREVMMLETELNERSSRFRAQMEPVTMEQVQRTLPPQAVLLEWIRYRPFIPASAPPGPYFSPARYAVYLLKYTGDPVLLDVGEAEAIDRQVTDLLSALRQPRGIVTVHGQAKELYKQLVDPLSPHLAAAKQLLISPDGQ